MKFEMHYLETFSIENTSFGVKKMNHKSKDEIDAFFTLFNHCFGKRLHLSKRWYEWYYCQNPTGECNNYLLFDIDNPALVGAYGFAKIQYMHNSEIKLGALGVNAMVSKEYGRKGLFVRLMQIALSYETGPNIAFSFPHGNNIGSEKGHLKAGWSLQENLHFYEMISKNHCNVIADTVKEIEKKNLNKIKFELFNKNSDFHFNRNEEFIKWRFFDRPSKEYVVLGNFVTEECINGYLIIGTYVNKHNGEVIKQIVDYRVEYSEVLIPLISKAFILEGDVFNIMISDHSNDLTVLKNMGFKRTEDHYKLMAFPDDKKTMFFNGLLGDFDVV